MNLTNFQSLLAVPGVQSALERNGKRLNELTEALASGMRISGSSDDAAGLALAEKLRSNARVYSKAVENVNTAISATSIALDALSELKNLVTKISEYSQIVGNTNSSSQTKETARSEALALADEYNRIVNTTSFNGQRIFNSEFSNLSVQAGYGPNARIGASLALSQGTLAAEAQYAAVPEFDTGGTTIASGENIVTASMTVGDFNNDGNDDLIFRSSPTNLKISLGNGSGTFSSPTTIATVSVADLASVDINNDGNLDLVGRNTSTSELYVYRGNGDGTFQAPTTYSDAGSGSAGRSNNPILIGDFNGDSRSDIVVHSGNSNELKVFLANPDGSLAPSVSVNVFRSGGSPGNYAVADFNNDGRDDLYLDHVGAGGGSILLSNGDGTFATTSVGGLIGTVTVGDFNNDGNQDFIGTLSSTQIFLGNGNGTFQSPVTLDTGYSLLSPVTTDLNNDGNLDFVGYNTSNNSLEIFTGDGTGSFTKTTVAAASTFSPNIRFGDGNGDGLTDIFLHNPPSSGMLFYRNISDADITQPPFSQSYLQTFQANLTLQEGRTAGFMGRLEVAVSNLDATVQNLESAYGRIMDIDAAETTAEYVKLQAHSEFIRSLNAHWGLSPLRVADLLKDD